MSNRQVFPETGFPILRGDVIATTGATSCTVVGIQGIPIISPPIEPAGLDTFFYDSYNNDWFYASPWDIPIGQVLEFTGYGYGTAALSWLASDTLAIGDGTPGDVSGGLGLTALILFGPTHYGSPYGYGYDDEYGSPYDQFYTTLYSGATQDWTMTLPSGPGTAGYVLATEGNGVTYWAALPTALPPNGTAGGDLSGSYPNPTVAKVNGGSVPTSKTIVGTNSSGQIVDASSATLANNTSGTAANLSGTPALPNGTTATEQAAGSADSQIATDSYVDRAVATETTRAEAAEALLAPQANPSFTGSITAPSGSISSGAITETFNNQTGTSYAIATGDNGKIVTFKNSTASTIVAATIAQAGSAGFAAGWWVELVNLGSNGVMITPTTSTIGGCVQAFLPPGSSCVIYSDGTNYQVICNGVTQTATGAGIYGPLTPAQGMLGTASSVLLAAYASGGSTATANDLACMGFSLLASLPITRTVSYLTIASSGNFAYWGIYDYNGNRITYSKQSTTTATTVETNNLTTSTLLLPGTYYFAWGCDNTTAKSYCLPTNGNGQIGAIANRKLLAYCANTISSGAMPATLGTLTTSAGQAFQVPTIWFES